MEQVDKVWDAFREEVENLFFEKYRHQCGFSAEQHEELINRFAEVLEYGFDDKDGADRARSELLDEINDSLRDRAYFEELSNAWWGNRL